MKEIKSTALVAALSMFLCSAMPAYAVGDGPPTFDFLKVGSRGSLIGKDDAHLKLILKTTPIITVSADQPWRGVTRIQTERFFSLWPTFFGDKPLNALLTVKVAGKAAPVPMVLRIKNPVYHPRNHKVTYEAARLDRNPRIDEGSVGLISGRTSRTPHKFAQYYMSFDSVQVMDWPKDVKIDQAGTPTIISYDPATTKKVR